MAASAYFETVQKIYIAFYQRPADPAGLKYWAEQINAAGGNPNAVITAFGTSPEATALYGAVTAATIGNVIEAIYQAAFNRAADAAGKAYWTAAFNAGTITASSIALAVVQGATGGDDAIAIANKLQVANEFTRQVDGRDLTDPYFGTGSSFNATYSGDTDAQAARDILKTVTANPATVLSPSQVTEQIQNKIADAGDPIKGQTGGQIYMLTKGLDNVPGTSGNDTIIGSISATAGDDLDTLSTLDIVNGGAGVDTLKIASAVAAIRLPNMSNVEVVEIEGTAGVTVDTSTVAGVTNLNVLKHGTAAVGATAAATTDVAVTLKENGAGVLGHTVNGGNNVTVTAADAGAATGAVDTITIGGTTAAKGDVVVNVTGKAYDAAAAQIDLGAVTVTGGKTVSVTQKASSDTSKVAADTTANKVVQGAVTVNANTETTTITVKQDAAVAAKNAAKTTGGVTETATVKFGALKGGDALTINGLTFTAATGVNLTAEEVAAAFSNMVSGLANADTDTQGSQVTAKGAFTGQFATGANTAAGYTAAAASGDTVVFTAARANQVATDLTPALTNTSGNSVAPTVTIVQGVAHNATPAGGVMGVDAGAVTIGGGSAATAVKTITVDGYAATSSAITGTTSALETLNLSNGGNFGVTEAATTLALNLTNVGTATKAATPTSAAVTEVRAVLDLNNAATKTLNVKSTGTNTVSLDLAGATGTTALNVSGTGTLDAKTASNLGAVTTIKVTETAGLNLGSTATTNVTSVDTTGTTGATTIAIDGGKATYAGGAGVDTVTVSAATGGFTKAIDLGAGNDTLNLEALSVAQLQALPVTNVLKGGEGDDTIALTAAQAVDLSANSTFAGKIEGFEKLSLTKATATGTVNLANLDNINYVVSKGSDSVASAATKTTFTVDLTGSTLLVGSEDSLTFAGATLAPTTDITSASALALALDGLTYTGWVVKSVAGNTITFEASATGATAVPAPVFTLVDAGGTASVFAQSTTSSTLGAGIGAVAAALTIDNLANGGTLELTGESAGAIVKVKDAATGTADVLNVVTKVLDTGTGAGTVTAENVETINLKVNNAATGLTDAGYKSADGVNNVFTPNVSTTTITLKGNDSLKAVTVDGAGHVKLLDSSTINAKLATIDANALTGNLTLDLSAHNGVAVTVTGGKGNDVLTASQGTNAKADVLVGGEGNDTLAAGSNGAKLTGGAGNDLFVLTAGTKEANTYSSILDFQAGDVLELNVIGSGNVAAFAKLTAVLNENTSVFSNFVDAAIQQATTGQAVWFQYKGNAYVVVDNVETGTASADVFQNGQDAVIELVGIDLANASYNSTHGTVALI